MSQVTETPKDSESMLEYFRRRVGEDPNVPDGARELMPAVIDGVEKIATQILGKVRSMVFGSPYLTAIILSAAAELAVKAVPPDAD